MPEELIKMRDYTNAMLALVRASKIKKEEDTLQVMVEGCSSVKEKYTV